MSICRSPKQKILIVDDSEMNRAILAEMLGNEYEIIEAENGAEAVAMLQKYSVSVSLVLLDIVMPVMDGYEVLAVMNANKWIEDVPVIMISSENSKSYVERAYELGVTDFIGRPFDAAIVRRRVINTILLNTKKKNLESLVAEQIYEKENNSRLMISILSHIVEFRNGESGLHVLHVQTITEMLLRHLSLTNDKYMRLSGSEITAIGNASALHDIGKIAIPDEILNKPGKLTKEEFEIMKTHSMEGAKVLEDLPLTKSEPLIKFAYEICRWHHERYDGKGYPDGLKGDEIPISAQVVSIADVYDALTSERCYKKAFTHEKAMEMILGGECGCFNPDLIECLKTIADDLKNELNNCSFSLNREHEFKSLADEIRRHKELTSSERTLRLLEHERAKTTFFAAVSKSVQFEYTYEPEMLIFSPYGAKTLGISEAMINPLDNLKLLSVVPDEDVTKIRMTVRSATPDKPVVKCDCKVNIGGSFKDVRMIFKTTWSYDAVPQRTGVIGAFTDPSDEEFIATQSYSSSYDMLTGLPTCAYAKKYIENMLAEESDNEYVLGVVDVDQFKEANEKYGCTFADNLLIHTAEKLRRILRRGDVAVRVGGDEFVIMVKCRLDAEAEIRQIFACMHDENDLLPISVSMGAVKAERGDNSDTLVKKANQALYAAKLEGNGQLKIYDESMSGNPAVNSGINEIEGR